MLASLELALWDFRDARLALRGKVWDVETSNYPLSAVQGEMWVLPASKFTLQNPTCISPFTSINTYQKPIQSLPDMHAFLLHSPSTKRVLPHYCPTTKTRSLLGTVFVA